MTQHVVIVDDDDLTLKFFTGIAAEIPDVVVHPFLSSAEAIDWYHGKEVDCFVFDYNMPLPNGMQMIALVRALPEFAHVPIVIVTGAHEREVRYQALDTGATDFLQKPVDYREMVARLTTLLALRSAQKKLALQVDSLAQSLLDSEERSREHAERLEALWGIANNPNLRDEELMLAMLQRGAAAIRPGQAYRGVLARVENGTHMRLISVADAVGYQSAVPAERREGEGALVLLSDTVAGQTMAVGGGTHAFDDIRATGHYNDFVQKRGWRAMIVTIVYRRRRNLRARVLIAAGDFEAVRTAGHGLHRRARVVLCGALPAALAVDAPGPSARARLADGPLEPQPLSLARTGRVRRGRVRRDCGRQLSRLPRPSTKRTVTSPAMRCWSKSRPRSRPARRRVRSSRASGGNSFAIFLPDVPSRDALDAHLARFGAAFDDPMGIGDREGKESVHVSAPDRASRTHPATARASTSCSCSPKAALARPAPITASFRNLPRNIARQR